MEKLALFFRRRAWWVQRFFSSVELLLYFITAPFDLQTAQFCETLAGKMLRHLEILAMVLPVKLQTSVNR